MALNFPSNPSTGDRYTSSNTVFEWDGSKWITTAFTNYITDTIATRDSSTGVLQTPTGTSAQRPASPNQGEFRFNSELNTFEGWDGTAWGEIATGTSDGGSY